jgi:hypothetical protein
VLDVFNDATLAALVGAAAAYLLVAATDRRRNRRIATAMLPELLRRTKVLIAQRTKSASDALAAVDRNPPMQNIGLPFPAERIERYADQVPDRLTDPQAFALANIAFFMREADRLNAVSLGLAQQVEEVLAHNEHGGAEMNELFKVAGLKDLLRKRYAEERALIERAGQIIDAYRAGRLSDTGGLPAPEARA